MASCVFTLPFDRAEHCFHLEEFQRFCATHRIIASRPEFFTLDGQAWWTVWIEYEARPRAEKTLETETATDLSEAEASLYEEIRAWRIKTAEQQGVPAYAILTNREMIELIRLRPGSLAALRAIRGIGKSKLDRFGKALLLLLNKDKANGEPQVTVSTPKENVNQEPANGT